MESTREKMTSWPVDLTGAAALKDRLVIVCAAGLISKPFAGQDQTARNGP